MQGRIIFDERGEYVSSLAPVEYGPLRPSQLSDAEKSELLPGWAYGDHDDLPYVTTADHRSVEGRIVPLGSECLASRRSGVVQLRVMGERGGTIVLDGVRWCVPVKGAPVLEPSEYPELFLPA